MKYAHICRYVATTPWAMYGPKLVQLLSVLAYRASGGEFTPEEIRAQIGDVPPSTPSKRGGGIAVLPLRGVIAHRMGTLEESSGGMSTERFGKMFKLALADESVGTIVFDVDSPGGTVSGVPELAAEILAARGQKRVVAVANAMMCSAAYWIAATADEIVATPSALVGSIGVYTAHEDLSRMLEQEGITVTLISAGTHKLDGNPFEPLDKETRDALQDQVDEAYGMFVRDVAKGRGVTTAAVRHGYGEGRAVTASEAKALGLVDRIGTLDETLARLVGRRQAGSGVRAEVEGGIYQICDIPEAPELAEMANPEGQADAGHDIDAYRRRAFERF